MELETVVNEQAYKELSKIISSRASRWLLLVALVIFALVAIWGMAIRSWPLAITCVVAIVVYVALAILLPRKRVRLVMDRMRERYGEGDEFVIPVTFGDETLVVNGADGAIGWKNSSFDSLYESEHYLVLMSKAKQMVILDKAQFTDVTRAEFMDLVKERMPQVELKRMPRV